MNNIERMFSNQFIYYVFINYIITLFYITFSKYHVNIGDYLSPYLTHMIISLPISLPSPPPLSFTHYILSNNLFIASPYISLFYSLSLSLSLISQH